MDTQSNILRCDPDGRGKERIRDVILAVGKLDIQADRIISIALSMLAEASDSEIIRRNTAFWHRARNGYHRFENVFFWHEARDESVTMAKKKKSLPRGIEPRSPALIGINDKRKSSPLDQGRCDGRVTARPLGWLMKALGHLDLMSDLSYHIYF
ncbi:hypothetical protein VN97_g9124 [Penicillium thymicola]|uniref:Uncharacterized protein n=1 Tax=Penicillium thymicola TaxID=293382 RepID=A0AAI9TC24_PENTH|nr:hypothetical protein VN97_g9124 [Penicillium thymicola]